MLTNRVLSAAEAADWGVINQSIAAEALEKPVTDLASSFATGPTGACGTVKRLLNQSVDNGLETQMEIEGRGIIESSVTEDGQEGMKAFLEKRKPIFKGR